MTYRNDPTFKSAFLAEISRHEQADALQKGSYGVFDPQFRGCAIGCAVFALRSLQGLTNAEGISYADHATVAADLGWPLWLAHLDDDIFESLPVPDAATWPRRLAEAIPVGAVITDAVLAKILVWSLTAPRFGVIHTTGLPVVQAWITTLADAITADATGTITADQREAAARAANDARDAWSAWDAHYARDAWSAWAAWDVWNAWATMAARAARATRTAMATWAAMAAWDAWNEIIRDAYAPALATYVLSLLRELPTAA